MKSLDFLVTPENSITRAKIIGSGVFLPKQVVTSENLFDEFNSETQYGWPSDWMSRFLGIKERRMASASCKPSDLAIPAAKKAIEMSGVKRDKIDTVIFCGIERDQAEPATAHVIQDALGLQATTVFDMSNACYGFVEAMELASRSIRFSESTYALIVTGETPTKVVRSVVEQLKAGMPLEQAKKIIGALTVGDAGGAVIIGRSESEQATGFQFFSKVVDSQHYKMCLYRMGKNGVPTGQMDMGPLTKKTLDHHADLIPSSLEHLGCPEFDWTLLHQTGIRQIQGICNLDGINPQRTIKTLEKLGNLTTATFAVSFNQLENNAKVKKGDRIGCCFIGSGLVIGHSGYIY